MKYNSSAFSAAFLPAISLVLAMCAQLGAEPVDITATTISAMILDDGVHTQQYMGDVDRGIPPTLSVPLYFFNGDRIEAIEIPFGNLSAPFDYRGPRELTFYSSRPSQDQDDPLPPEAGRVVLSEDLSDTLLIFYTEDFNNLTFRILYLDDSTKRFPQNTARVYNLSSTTVAFQLGDSQLSIAPNQLEWTDVDPEKAYQRVRFASLNDSGDWIFAYNRYTRVRRGHRMLYLILDAPTGGANPIMIRRVQDPVSVRQQNTEERSPLSQNQETPLNEANRPEGSSFDRHNR